MASVGETCFRRTKAALKALSLVASETLRAAPSTHQSAAAPNLALTVPDWTQMLCPLSLLHKELSLFPTSAQQLQSTNSETKGWQGRPSGTPAPGYS